MLINHSRIEQAMTYGEYSTLLETLIKINQTTGTNQSADMIEYAKLNLQRIRRLDTTTVVGAALQEKVRGISGKYIWLVLTEGWCGDASQILPVVNKIAELNPNIQLLFLLRDENLDIMDNYLTKGGRSIPKVIILEAETLTEITNWGPRPKEAQELFWQLKEAKTPYDDIKLQVHTWYAKNKTKAIQDEFAEIVELLK